MRSLLIDGVEKGYELVLDNGGEIVSVIGIFLGSYGEHTKLDFCPAVRHGVERALSPASWQGPAIYAAGATAYRIVSCNDGESVEHSWASACV
jgi:hypothetical protein